MPGPKQLLSPKLIPVLALLTLLIPAAVCQLNSNTASVALNATLGESLTVAATPSTVTILLVSGRTALGSSPVTITTTWNLRAGRAAVTLVGYFSSATAALTDGAATPSNIPSSEVLGQIDHRNADRLHGIYPGYASGRTRSGLEVIHPEALGNKPNCKSD